MTYRLTLGSDVVRLSDGAVIPADPLNRDRAEYDAWAADGGVPEPAPATPDIPPRTMTPREFMDRLTMQRQGEITAAAMQSAPLLLWLIRLSSAQEVDVTFPETLTGVEALRLANIITEDEAAALLAPAP